MMASRQPSSDPGSHPRGAWRLRETAGALGACCAALAATPRRVIFPRPPDERLLPSLPDAAAPVPRRTVKLTALRQAQSAAPAMLVAEGARRPWMLSMSLTAFLVEHPRATFLIDPALCADVHSRVLPELPLPLRWLLAPPQPVEGVVGALARAGVTPAEIDFVLPTHLHWDHVAGLLDLPDELPVHTSAVEWDYALRGPRTPPGVARGPLQDRNVVFYALDGPPVLAFDASRDLFGDGSVVLVGLAGHTPGSVGILLAVDDGRRVLLAGDAVWHPLQISLLRQRAPFPGLLVDAGPRSAFTAVHRLYAVRNSVAVLASHDPHAAADWGPRA